jgi:hypothetical protein
MTKTPFDTRGASHGADHEATSDGVFALAASALALAMLALFGVLLLVDVVGLARILPFAALSLALFFASAFLLWRWALGEARMSTAQDVAHRTREAGKR